MLEILKKLSEKPLIFKGGSALMFFYGLDRFSEDLDFDCNYKISVGNLVKVLEAIGSVNLKKDTDTVKRLIVSPCGKDFSVKVEISLRGYPPLRSPIKVENALCVYDINDLFRQKINALVKRHTARDLYDVGFIVEKYYDVLLPELKKSFFSLFSSKESIYDLIPEYELAFSEDDVLTDSDLLRSVARLMSFYEKMETELRKREVDEDSEETLGNNPGW